MAAAVSLLILYIFLAKQPDGSFKINNKDEPAIPRDYTVHIECVHSY
jgi:hypothetical protein